jgi:RNA polymerase sigma factor (sigma-70 family)
MQMTQSEMPVPAVTLDSADIGHLIRVHSRRLYSFVRRRIGNPEDVEDLVQETCLEALRCLPKFQGQSRPETWLFGIAMNLMRNYYKTAKLHDIFDYSDTDEFPHAGTEDTVETAERHETLELLSKALEQLPEETQRILEMIFDGHYSYEEVAAKMGIPIGTVRSRISRARAILKDGIR